MGRFGQEEPALLFSAAGTWCRGSLACLAQAGQRDWDDPQSRQWERHCTKPDGIRQVLCSRTDTSAMCRFYDAQTAGASLEMPILADGVTIFVMVDAAISRLKYMNQNSGLGEETAPPAVLLSCHVVTRHPRLGLSPCPYIGRYIKSQAWQMLLVPSAGVTVNGSPSSHQARSAHGCGGTLPPLPFLYLEWPPMPLDALAWKGCFLPGLMSSQAHPPDLHILLPSAVLGSCMRGSQQRVSRSGE